MLSAPSSTSSAAGMLTVIDELPTVAGVSLVPAKVTVVAPGLKLAPLMVSVNDPEPSTVDVLLRLLMVGPSTVQVNDVLPLTPSSTAETLTGYTPNESDDRIVPEMTPVLPLMVRPPGSPL